MDINLTGPQGPQKPQEQTKKRINIPAQKQPDINDMLNKETGGLRVPDDRYSLPNEFGPNQVAVERHILDNKVVRKSIFNHSVNGEMKTGQCVEIIAPSLLPAAIKACDWNGDSKVETIDLYKFQNATDKELKAFHDMKKVEVLKPKPQVDGFIPLPTDD